MTALTHSGETAALAAITSKAPGGVVSAIRNASHNTGVDFAYLVQQAKAESSFNPSAKAKTSSAEGLYQFIESTWLAMVRDHGDKHGLGGYADMIDARGKVSDPAQREEILALRQDPRKASLLAAELALDNKRSLERSLGREAGATELYFAHFMGAGGAASFLKAKDDNPLLAGADLFPREARANQGVFYDRDSGQPRTLAEIYEFFDKKFSVSGPEKDSAPSPLRIADNEPPGAYTGPGADYLRTMPAMMHPLNTERTGAGENPVLLSLGVQDLSVLSGSLLLAPADIMFLSELNEDSRNKDNQDS
jgi:hypothetical protein